MSCNDSSQDDADAVSFGRSAYVRADEDGRLRLAQYDAGEILTRLEARLIGGAGVARRQPVK